MDPQATLNLLLDAIDDWHKADTEDKYDIRDEVIQHLEDLAEWLKNDGAMPTTHGLTSRR